MTHLWLLMTFTWFGTVRLQNVMPSKVGEDAVSNIIAHSSPIRNPILYSDYYSNLPPQNEDPDFVHSYNQYYETANQDPSLDLQRYRRTIDNGPQSYAQDQNWVSNLLQNRNIYVRDGTLRERPIITIHKSPESGAELNTTGDYAKIDLVDKRSFSPWGGKRSSYPKAEYMWTWTRASSKREPSMPKRVRFSPWGGKRSGQLIYKPGSKAAKIILSSYVPGITPIISKYTGIGQKLNLAGFHILPSLDRRLPVRILALTTKFGDRYVRDTSYDPSELSEKMFKPGHPFLDVNLKTDGKRKVKFNTWGGKRSPPIIGPIWTPSSQHGKDTTLDAILLIRNSQDVNEANAS